MQWIIEPELYAYRNRQTELISLQIRIRTAPSPEKNPRLKNGDSFFLITFISWDYL